MINDLPDPGPIKENKSTLAKMACMTRMACLTRTAHMARTLARRFCRPHSDWTLEQSLKRASGEKCIGHLQLLFYKLS